MQNKINNIKETVKLFKIFSDNTRLRIIDLLVTGEYCVQDIADNLETSQSAISHQLKLLRDLLFVEFCVQIVEGIFYIWMVINFNKNHVRSNQDF